MLTAQDPLVFSGTPLLSEPVTFLTDALTGLLSLGFAHATRSSHTPENSRRAWHAFFWWMGVATLFGALRHGFSHTQELWWWFRAASWLCSGLAVMGAVQAAAALVLPPWRRRLRIAGILLFGAFAVSVFVFQWFAVVRIYSAAGMLGIVLPVYGSRWLKGGCNASGWVVAGIGMAALLAGVHIAELSLHKWFNYHDVSHVVLAGSLACFYRGVKKAATA